MERFLSFLKKIYMETPTYKTIRKISDNLILIKILLFIVDVLTTFFATHIMISMQKVIDSVTYGEANSLTEYTTGFISIITYIVLYLSCDLINNIVMFLAGIKFYRNTLGYLFVSYYKKHFTYAQNTDSGDFASKLMNDTRTVANWVGVGTVALWAQVFAFGIIFVTLYNYHHQIAITTVILITIAFLFTRSINEKIAYYNKLEHDVMGEMYQFFIQVNKSFMDIKQLRKENLYISKMYDLLDKKLFYYQKKWFFWRTIYNSIYTIITYLMPIGILLFGVYLTLKGCFTIGKTIAIYTLSSQTQEPLLGIASNISERHSTMVLSERLKDFVIDINRQEENNKAIEHFEKLDFSCIDFAYEKGPKFLHNISFSIKNNDILCIKGKSGKGKSTIASLLMQFYNLENGYIRINGTDIYEYNKQDYYSNINLLSQNSFIFQDTIKNNITIGENFPQELYEEVLSTVQLNDVIEKYSDQLVLDEDAANISGGQKQRISLARLLIRKPKLLILDEPTSALDDKTALLLISSLKNYIEKYGMSLIIITHSSVFDKIATNILEI